MPLTGIRGKGGSGKNTYFAYHIFCPSCNKYYENIAYIFPREITDIEKINEIKLEHYVCVTPV